MRHWIARAADQVVDHKKLVSLIMVVITAACGVLIPRVEVNTDMSTYLPADSQMGQGLEVMAAQFPDEATTQTIRVMFTGLPVDQAEAVKTELGQIKGVDSVDYTADDLAYNQDDHTLFVVNTALAYDSAGETAIEDAIRTDFAGDDMVLKNDSSPDGIPNWVIIVAVALLLAILLVLSGSWLEPLFIVAAIGLAIVINLGTNIVFGSVSNTAFEISAILQLVLSMNYSVILTSRYRQESRLTEDRAEAMKAALTKAFSSITGGVMAMVVGLSMLLFMRFRLGGELGLVLAKGVLLSMVSIFTIMPAFLLLFDSALRKTKKRILSLPTKALARFSYRARRVFAPVLIVLFAVSAILQGGTKIDFALQTSDPIADHFPPTNTIILVYDNADDAAATALAEKLAADDPHVRSATSYSTTMGKPHAAADLASLMGLDPAMVAQLYAYYAGSQDLTAGKTVTLPQFTGFLSAMVADPAFSSQFASDQAIQLAGLNQIVQAAASDQPLPGAQLAAITGMDQTTMVDPMLAAQAVTAMTLPDFLDAVIATAGPAFDQATQAKLSGLKTLAQTAASGQGLTPAQLAQELGMDQAQSTLVCAMYLGGQDQNLTLTPQQFVDFLVSTVAPDPAFASQFTPDQLSQLTDQQGQMAKGAASLKGPSHSRLILTTTYPDESDETTAFIDALEQDTASFQGDHYLIGNSVMGDEMAQTFDHEMGLIALLTALAIFVVVALVFRSLVVPAILVLIVQTGVFATIALNGVFGYSIYYLSSIIVQCILMGATIDYGILFSNYYREKRQAFDAPEALTGAYGGAIHTIATSGSIMVFTLGIIGVLPVDPSIGKICQVLSLGAFTVIVLILFVLPGLLAAFDKLVVGRRARQRETL
ncbi:MAG: MMPL family transporter [Propionibacteriaceae bacterium]|jgi:predicted RND superfamily exporter protein|nr:MMPL family transporter [Propionibacteriaceae bacterium]